MSQPRFAQPDQILATNQASKDSAAASTDLAAPARWMLLSLSLSMLMPSLDTSIANAALPALTQAFNASFQAAQWIILAYLLAITTLIVSAGRLGDLIGRRRMLLAGISLFTLASVLCGIAAALWFLIAARAMQGLGAAIMMALTLATISGTVAKEKAGRAMGLLGAMSAIGTTLGPSLGGMLLASFGWQAIFLVNVPLGIANFILACRYLPLDKPRPNKHQSTTADQARFDHKGMLLLGFSLAAYTLAMTTGHGSFGAYNLTLILAAVFGIALFARVEATAVSPLIRLTMFRDPRLSSSLVMSSLVATVMMTTLVVGPFYLARALRLDTAMLGLVLSVGPLVAALTGIPAGRVVDRFGTQGITVAGLTGIAIGCFALSNIPASFGIAGYIGPVILITTSYALFQAANNTAIMTDIHKDQRGVISGLLNLSRNLGLITGASVMGAVFAHASGIINMAAAHPRAIASAMHFTFTVAGLLIISALAIALAANHRKLARRTNPVSNTMAAEKL